MKLLLGAILLLVAPVRAEARQDLDDPLVIKKHRVSIRLPKGWIPGRVSPPTILMVTAPVRSKTPPRLMVIHTSSQQPEPISAFTKRLSAYLNKKYPGHKTLSEKEFKHGGHAAWQIKLSWKGKDGTEWVIVKTVIHLNHHDNILVDASWVSQDEVEYGAWVLRSIASIKFLPPPKLTQEERKGEEVFRGYLKRNAAFPAKLLTEHWQSIFIRRKKIGFQMQSLLKKGNEYLYAQEMHMDLGPGGKSVIRANGRFTPDARFQTLEYEEIVTTLSGKVETKTVYRANLTLKDGRVSGRRVMDGVTEKVDFPVEPGLVFNEVGDVIRAALITEGKKSYLIRRLSPFRPDPKIEFVEVSNADEVEWLKGKREIRVIQSLIGEQVTTYWFGTSDLALLRMTSGKSPFHVLGVTKEEAVGGK